MAGIVLKIFSNLEALSQGAAELFTATAEQAITSRGRFSVLVSGGETPRRTYELLAQEPFRHRIQWDRVHLFWGDERCVAASDPRSNASMVRQALLDKVPVPERQIHPIACDAMPQTTASAYETLLRAHFQDVPPRFDLVMLGLGDDGHTASLFPGSDALNERHRWVTTTQKPGENIMRVTLTPTILNLAGRVVFLVAGTGKAPVLHKLLEGSPPPGALPAQLINPISGKLLWYVEESAANLLTTNINLQTKER